MAALGIITGYAWGTEKGYEKGWRTEREKWEKVELEWWRKFEEVNPVKAKAERLELKARLEEAERQNRYGEAVWAEQELRRRGWLNRKPDL